MNIVFNYLFDVVIVMPRYSWNTAKVDVRHQSINLYCANLISGVMVSIVASSGLDRGVKSCSGQTKDYKVGICCFSAKHAALMRKRQDWFARNQMYVLALSLSWSYGSWIYNYKYVPMQSVPMLRVWIPLMARCIRYNIILYWCQWLATGLWFSPDASLSFINKTDRHDTTEILLKVTLNIQP